MRKVVLRIVEGRLVLVAESQVQSDLGRQLPVVLDVHAVELDVRIGNRAADHLRGTVQRAQQEGGVLVAIVQGVRIVERVGRQGRVEIEVRRARHVAEAVAFALFKADFEIVRASLLRDLDAEALLPWAPGSSRSRRRRIRFRRYSCPGNRPARRRKPSDTARTRHCSARSIPNRSKAVEWKYKRPAGCASRREIPATVRALMVQMASPPAFQAARAVPVGTYSSELLGVGLPAISVVLYRAMRPNIFHLSLML